MTPEEISLVQQSVAQVKPIAPQACALFYQNLFAIAPELRPLFKADVNDQGRKLMDMLTLAVGLLRQPQRLSDAIMHLGTRHASYGVTEAHFQPVGEAMIATLRQSLGADFRPEVEMAWQSMYQELITRMAESLRVGYERRRVLELRAELARKRMAMPWWRRMFSHSI